MAWWRARVVAPARRAWLAVLAARGRTTRKRESTGIVGLHRDVQTCGYRDVQVMWDMLGLENGASAAPECRKRPAAFWYLRSSHGTATAR